jgi:hypothetical protein
MTIGGEAFGGRDVDGKSFSRLSGFVRYGGDEHTRDDGSLDEDSYRRPDEHGAERFVDAGMNVNRVHTDRSRGCRPPEQSGLRSAFWDWVRAARSPPTMTWACASKWMKSTAIRCSACARSTIDTAFQTLCGGLFAGRGALQPGDARLFDVFRVGRAVAQYPAEVGFGPRFRYAQNMARDHVLASDPQGIEAGDLLQDRSPMAGCRIPVGAQFNFETMRMELVSFGGRAVQPGGAGEIRAHGRPPATWWARCSCSRHQFLVSAARPQCRVAKRSMAVAASFGLACALSVVVLGDESGYVASENQKMKVAAIEAEWHTEAPPAGFTVFGLPDTRTRTVRAASRSRGCWG